MISSFVGFSRPLGVPVRWHRQFRNRLVLSTLYVWDHFTFVIDNIILSMVFYPSSHSEPVSAELTDSPEQGELLAGTGGVSSWE